MSWDSTKVDNDPSDLVNGLLYAVDYNTIVAHIKAIEQIIDGGDATG